MNKKRIKKKFEDYNKRFLTQIILRILQFNKKSK